MKRLNQLEASVAIVLIMLAGCSCVHPDPETTLPEEQKEEQEHKAEEQQGKEGQDDSQPEDLEDLKSTVPVTQDWIFSNRPSMIIRMENPNAVAVTADARVRIFSDMKQEICVVEKSMDVPAGATVEMEISTEQDLAPGFYRATCFVNKKAARYFVFGISPFQIESAPDKQSDFDSFWETGKAQLAAVDMNAELTEITRKSTDKCKVYLVEMNSVPDGLDGEPVVIRGYYLEPQDGKPHPVLMHFYGYDTQKNPAKLSCPGANNGDFAELYLSHRGQYINNRPADKREPDGKGDFENIYGDWFAYHFGDKDSYYYRGAFLDCVQGVRFMATRPTSDMENLFAEGSSQGGALCYAAAALSDIPFTAIAPNVAFLGDFPDYFRIVSWPGDTARANQGSMTDEEMFAFLSYFDTKNLATRISCAVWATSGLQDGTCPPHTNMAPFNNLPSTDKQMNFYPEMQHDYPRSWNSDIMQFFKTRIKNR